jgi:hypothetical protein
MAPTGSVMARRHHEPATAPAAPFRHHVIVSIQECAELLKPGHLSCSSTSASAMASWLHAWLHPRWRASKYRPELRKPNKTRAFRSGWRDLNSRPLDPQVGPFRSLSVRDLSLVSVVDRAHALNLVGLVPSWSVVVYPSPGQQPQMSFVGVMRDRRPSLDMRHRAVRLVRSNVSSGGHALRSDGAESKTMEYLRLGGSGLKVSRSRGVA